MIPQLTGQALALVTLAILGLMLSKLTRVDKTLCCLAIGFLAGLLVAPLGLDTGVRAGSVQDLVFYLLLPPLLFQAAWHISPSMLRRWAAPVLTFLHKSQSPAVKPADCCLEPVTESGPGGNS